MSNKIIFFGTSIFSVEVLEQLKKRGLVPEAVVTTVDKPQGRRLILTPSPVKVWAVENGVEVLQFDKLNGEAIEVLKKLNPDLFIVASYGKIIPQAILDIPKHGALNIHPSLLPKYRGPSPLQNCILDDNQNTGITIIKMDAEMDHGPIVAMKTIKIQDWPVNILKLKKILGKESADVLADLLPKYLAGELELIEQNHSQATFTKKIVKSDGEIDLNGDPWKNFLKTQAYFGWPGTFFFIERHGKKIRVKINNASFDKENNKLIIDKITPEGGKEMRYEDFLKG